MYCRTEHIMSSGELLRSHDDLALTEAELQLRLRNADMTSEDCSLEEDVVRTALQRRSRQIVNNSRWIRGLPEPRVIQTAFAIADLLGGQGFLTGRGVIEVTGEASSGKTQLLLDVALSCPRKVAYICTEGRFPDDRLKQLTSYTVRWPNASMDRVLISRVADLDQLSVTLNQFLPRLLETQPIDAVIVDSITWPFRVEDGCKERTKSIQDAVRTLHRLSKDHNILVICSNHVAADLVHGGMRPCLGTSWSKGEWQDIDTCSMSCVVDVTEADGISGRLVLSIKDREKGIRGLRVAWCEDYLPWSIGKERDFCIRAQGLVPLHTQAENKPATEKNVTV